MAAKAPAKKQAASRLQVHEGNTLGHFSDDYPDLHTSALEAVQNAIDKDASHICVVVDLKNRSVIIADDGVGASLEDFDKSLASVAMSRKGGQTNRYGKYGLGLIGFLKKGKTYTFTSQSGTGPPIQWTFEWARIQKVETGLTIPRENLSTLPKIPPPLNTYADMPGVKWRTMLAVNELVDDRQISKFDVNEFGHEVLLKYRSEMLKREIVVRVILRSQDGDVVRHDFVASDFTGEPLGVFKAQNDEVGRVEIELYRARPKGRKRSGEVMFSEMENPSTITWKQFYTQVTEKGLSDLTPGFEALASGYFEGVIRGEKVTVAASRDRFFNDAALIGLYQAIAEWWETEGQALYDVDRQQLSDERRHRNAQKSMDYISKWLRDATNHDWMELVREALPIELAPPTPEPEPTLGPEPAPGSDTPIPPRKGTGQGPPLPGGGNGPGVGGGGPGGGTPPSGGGGGGGRPRPPAGTHRPPGTGGSATNPDRRGRMVGDGSIGLRLDFMSFELSSRLWAFDVKTGVLTINITHPVWLMLDDDDNPNRSAKNDKWVIKLQNWLIIQVLSMLKQPQELWAPWRDGIDLQTRPMVEMFIQDKA